MGVMAINNKEAGTAVCLLHRMFLEVGKPEYSQFTVCPSFLRIAKPFICGQGQSAQYFYKNMLTTHLQGFLASISQGTCGH
jgi:hypothetical protein